MRLQPKADSKNDPLASAALVGAWSGSRNSAQDYYGFADDGLFYKNTTITHTHLTSTYHSGYYSYGWYYSGYTTYNTNYTYTYLDTLVGKYKVEGANTR